MEFRVNEITPLQILMRDSTTGFPAAAVTPSSVRLVKAGGAVATLTSGVDFTWTELDAVNMTGLYRFTPLTTVLTTTEGDCALYVNAAGCVATIRGYTVKPIQYEFTEGGAYVPPRVLSCVPSGPRGLVVTFTKDMLMTTGAAGALLDTNYTLNGSVVDSVTQIDARTVQLRTSSRTPGVTYTLAIGDVEDLDGNVLVN